MTSNGEALERLHDTEGLREAVALILAKLSDDPVELDQDLARAVERLCEYEEELLAIAKSRRDWDTIWAMFARYRRRLLTLGGGIGACTLFWGQITEAWETIIKPILMGAGQ